MGLGDEIPLKTTPKGVDLSPKLLEVSDGENEDDLQQVQIKPRFHERDIVNQFTNTIVKPT